MTDLTTLDSEELESRLEQHRTELTGYCYRMLGSSADAEDAVQDTMVRAWRGYDRFEGRSALRSWLYRIATNVCFDMLNGKQRRARPMDFGPAKTADAPLAPPTAEATWLEPMPDSRVLPSQGDPADLAVARETIRLAFVAALQHLPPRQRAVLILREVLRWQATEVAELLDTTVASVNSALQRARATLEANRVSETDAIEPLDEEQAALLARYVDAFERYDLDEFVSLLSEDVRQSMPPYAMWLIGGEQIRQWMLGPGIECKGSRLIPTVANGAPAFAQYRPSGPDGSFEPWALHVLEISDGQIIGLNFFLSTDTLFPIFGLPATPDASSARRLVGEQEHVVEPDNGEEVAQLDARVLQLDRLAAPPHGELQPAERVDRHRVGVVELDHVADDPRGVAAVEQAAQSRAEPRDVGASDRRGDDQDQRSPGPFSKLGHEG